MNKSQTIKFIDEKVDELKSTIASLKTNETLSKSTRGTQLYARGRERRVLLLIRELISNCNAETKLSEPSMDTLTLITTLASERVQQKAVEVKEGDKLMDLLKKYEDRKDILKKLQTAAEKIGCVVDFTTQTIKHK